MAVSGSKVAARRRGADAGDALETVPGGLGYTPPHGQSGIVSLDAKGHILQIDAEALQLLHHGLPDLAGRHFWDAVPDDVVEHHQAATLEALASHAQHSFVVHHEFEGGWTEYAFIRHATGCVVTLRDVTASRNLKRMLEDSERRNQLIFEANPNAMWIFDDVSQRIIAANQAAVEFYGISRKTFLTLRMGALFPDGEGLALLSTLESGSASGEGELTAQICKQKKMDGQVVLVELACGRIRWNEHKAVLVSLADVTERHLADRALRRENAEMEEEIESLGAELKQTRRDLAAFTYALSNDLQAPLHAANGFAAILIDKYAGVLDDAGQRYVHRIQASTRQLARLVDDLRSLVQLPPRGEVGSMDVAAVCVALMDDLRKQEPTRKVTIETDAAHPLMADKNLVTRALACLLDNAWKFTSKKPEAWVNVTLQESPAGELILQVSDNGPGFDAEYSDKLFTAFQRLHSSADFPGNGLGLAIVKSVAERHGGRVWAETDATGASFFMAFPQSALPPAAPG